MNIDWQQPYWLILLIPVMAAILFFAKGGQFASPFRKKVHTIMRAVLCFVLILAMAILTGVAGFLLIFRPSESIQIIMILFGIVLITEGVLNLITILITVKIIRHQMPEVIDAEYCEIEQEP